MRLEYFSPKTVLYQVATIATRLANSAQSLAGQKSSAFYRIVELPPIKVSGKELLVT
jgi:hypothetical protein